MRAWFLFASVCFAICHDVAGQQNVLDTIASKPNLSLFYEAIVKAGYENLLSDKTEIAMVFAPNNDAMLLDPVALVYMQHGGWSKHLQDMVGLHIVLGAALTRPAIFNFRGDIDFFTTLGGEVEVSKEEQTVAGQDVLTTGFFTVNGIAHIVNGVFQNEWRGNSLNDLAAAVAPFLHSVVLVAGLEEELSNLVVSGMTLLGPSDASIAKAGKNLSTLTETVEFVNSHLFQGLLYADMLLGMDGETITSVNRKQYLVTVEGSTITVSSVENKSSFATIIAEDILSLNGVFHHIDGVLLAGDQMPAASVKTDLPITVETEFPSDFLVGDTSMPSETLAPSIDYTSDGTLVQSIDPTVVQDDTTATPSNETLPTETSYPSSSWTLIAPLDGTNSTEEDTLMGQIETDAPSGSWAFADGPFAHTHEPSMTKVPWDGGEHDEKDKGTGSYIFTGTPTNSPAGTPPTSSPTELVDVVIEVDEGGFDTLPPIEFDSSTPRATSDASSLERSMVIASVVLTVVTSSFVISCV